MPGENSGPGRVTTVKTKQSKSQSSAHVVSRVLNTIYNPAFDKRILSMPMLHLPTYNNTTSAHSTGDVITSGFQRGRIVREDGTFGVNFLYNPSTITVSHSADATSGILPSTVLDPNNIGVFNVPLQSTLSFETLFDRTFELWDSSLRSSMPGKYGAAVDVAAFYNICGMTFNTMDDFKANKANVKAPNDIIASPMQMYPCRVMFGGSYALAYNAWITGLEVQWLHWTQGMVPARCRVAVSMQLLPRQIALPDATTASTSGTTTTTSGSTTSAGNASGHAPPLTGSS